uniref:RagB/SusD family nutrient uptake outer membrane protein n=1 Tax=uncultured Draconibacterium sp. TaxID=1573823 RepID=UPI0032178EE6
MKKVIHKYIFLIITITSISSCDFLEVDPIGKTTIPILFSDMEGIRAALPGAYSAVYEYYDSEFSKYPEVAGNMVYLNIIGDNVEMINQYNFTSMADDETEAVGYIWGKIYKALANINNIIQYQPDLLAKYPQHENELNNILAESLFLRALSHFDLVRVYGQAYNYTSDASHLGVPVLLKTPGADDNVSRNTVNEVYTQVIADLEQAINIWNNSEDTNSSEAYFASKDAANALLSRVYLYMEDWDKVISYSTLLIDEIPLSQGQNYIDMYNNMVVGDEAIFRLNGTLKSSSLAKFYSPAAPIAIPADTLISLFDDPSDIRLALLKDDEGKKACRKYLIAASMPEKDKHYDPFVLRVTEMYLNRAEAYLNKNMLAEAAADVKAIIARGVGKSVSEIIINETDQAALNHLIEKERAKEFCFEGHQFFDITRKKQDLVREASTSSTVLRMNYPSDYFVLPISQKELDANLNIQPNPTVN